MWENNFDVAADKTADAEFTMVKAHYKPCVFKTTAANPSIFSDSLLFFIQTDSKDLTRKTFYLLRYAAHKEHDQEIEPEDQ